MIKDGGLSFKTQLKSEFLPLNNGSKKCLENPCNFRSFFALLPPHPPPPPSPKNQKKKYEILKKW